MQNEFLLNDEYEILTDEGFKDFMGLKSFGNQETIKITLKSSKFIECTKDHKIFFYHECYKIASKYSVNDVILTKDGFDIVECIENNDFIDVYDIVEVEDNHRLYCNNILIHQCLLLDEFAFISAGVFEEFIQSVYPTISSSKNSKIIMISTPNGMNHFYKFWHDAETHKNGYSNIEINWDDVPGRDESWKQQMIDEIGIDRWNQEFEAQFLGSSNTLLDSKCLRLLTYSDPKSINFESKLKIYTMPENNHIYVIMADVAEGVGGSADFSTVQVLDVSENPYKQVAVYKDNTMKPRFFSVIIAKIGKMYNEGLVIVENNTIGGEVLNNLNYNEEYENIFYDNNKFGMRMTKGSKSMGCSYMKSFIEEHKLLLFDFETIQELTTFTKNKNGTYSAESKKHDDLVTPLILFSYFMSKEDLVDIWLDKENVLLSIYDKLKDHIEDDLLPIGFFPDNYINDEDYI